MNLLFLSFSLALTQRYIKFELHEDLDFGRGYFKNKEPKQLIYEMEHF